MTHLTPYDDLNQQYIDGTWTQGQSERETINLNPYTQQQIHRIKNASTADVDRAYEVAKQAQLAWEQTAPQEKMGLIKKLEQLIQQRREEIITWLIDESGSTRIKANVEVDAALGIIQESHQFPLKAKGELLATTVAGQKSYVFRKALGVIAVISPWNFPFHLSMRSVVTALATGNTVVLKPASDAPVTGGTLLAKLFEEAGFPAGTLNVVIGAGSEIGDYFVTHEVPRLISFTGSTAIGKRVGELAVGGQHMKRVALELGGNAPMVVLHDADLEKAVAHTLSGRFFHQGQICMSTNRVIVDARIYDAFIERLAEGVKTIAFGDPSIMGTLVGPIINKAQLDNVMRIIGEAKASGARLLVGGDIIGQVIPPHIFVDVDPQSALAREESFGPVLPVIKADDEEHALRLANDTEYGLSSAVCTQDTLRGIEFALKIEAGMTHVNNKSIADHPNAPFGGEKNSGLGRFNGHWIFEEFTRTHWVTVQA